MFKFSYHVQVFPSLGWGIFPLPPYVIYLAPCVIQVTFFTKTIHVRAPVFPPLGGMFVECREGSRNLTRLKIYRYSQQMMREMRNMSWALLKQVLTQEAIQKHQSRINERRRINRLIKQLLLTESNVLTFGKLYRSPSPSKPPSLKRSTPEQSEQLHIPYYEGLIVEARVMNK